MVWRESGLPEMGSFVSHHRRLMILATALLVGSATLPARADAPFSIVFGLDSQRRPAVSIRAFGPKNGQKLFSFDAVDLGNRPSLYTEFKPPASGQAPGQQGLAAASNAKQSRAAAILNASLHLLRAITGHH